MTERKFHKYIFQYEIVSEVPLQVDDLNIEDLHHLTYEGPCSGRMLETHYVELNAKEAADALIEQGSDPEFFQIDQDGNDVDEDLEDDNSEEATDD